MRVDSEAQRRSLLTILQQVQVQGEAGARNLLELATAVRSARLDEVEKKPDEEPKDTNDPG